MSVDPTDRWNVGARSRFSTPSLLQSSTSGAAHFFYIGQVLSDGTFYQGGIAVNHYNCGDSCLGFFAQAFDPSGNQILNWPGCGSCYGAGTTGFHVYAIEHTTIGSINNWYLTFDGTRYPNEDIYPPAPNSGNNVPWVYAEVSNVPTGPTPDPADTMGPLTATSKALQTKFSGAWYDTYHADAWFQNPYCPPINVRGWGYQSGSVGTNLGGDCVGSGAILW